MEEYFVVIGWWAVDNRAVIRALLATTWPMRLVALVGGMCVVAVVVVDVARGQPVQLAVALAFLLPSYAVGLFACWHAPRHLTARRVLVASALLGMVWVNESLTAFVVGPDIGEFPAWRSFSRGPTGLLDFALIVMVVRLMALLPDGDYRRPYERMVLRTLWLFLPLWPALLVLGWVDIQVPPMKFAVWLLPCGPLLLAARYFLLPIAQRRTLRWLLGMALLVALAVSVPLAQRAAGGWDMAVVVAMLGMLVIPVGLVAAVFRYRMLDADIGIRRSTRYVVLWLTIGLWYLGVVAGLGVAAGNTLPIEVGVLVTVATAVAFQPVRVRLNRLAARWVYGRRLSGYELLVRVGSAMEHAHDPRTLAPELVHNVQEALGLRWARVQLGYDGDLLRPPVVATAAGTGSPSYPPDDQPIEVPLRHGDDVLGLLSCGPKFEGRFSSADHELLRTLARQAGLAMHNLLLSAELSARVEQVERQAKELDASRARIVHAQDIERRRIERDLHDGIQQELIALVTRLRLARNHLASDLSRADTELTEMQGDTYRVIDELRELARGIHPSELSDQGLVAAVASRARRAPIPVTLMADESTRAARFAPEIEGTAYFVVSEALANILKHAHAERASIVVSLTDGSLLVEVVDYGVGLPAETGSGSGLTGLRDRAEAVGGTLRVTGNQAGGTTVLARLPARRGTDA